MKFKLGDNVVLKDVEFKEYNGKVFTIIDIIFEGIYQVARDGFDSIYVTEQNFV